MNVETEPAASAAEGWPERRQAAARRLSRLVRRLGPDGFRMTESFDLAMADALSKCPDEQAVLSVALNLCAVDEIVRLRGSDEPNAYLPTIAEALANRTGHPRDLTTWAVRTWHEVLADPRPTPDLTEPSERPTTAGPPAPGAALGAGVLIGLCAFVSAGLSECLTIKLFGPTIVQTMIADRAAPAPPDVRTRDRARREASWERMKTLAPIGLVLTGSVAGIATFCAWGLSGGTWRHAAKAGLVATVASAVACLGLNAFAIFTRQGLAMSPPVESLCVLAFLAVVTFGATFGAVANEPPPPEEERLTFGNSEIYNTLDFGATDES